MYRWLSNKVLASRKGIEDVIVSIAAQVAAALTGFVTVVLLARGLGPADMGNYALIISIPGLASALSDLGIGQTAIRFASQAAAQNDVAHQMAVLRWAFRLRILLVLVISGLAYIFAPFIAESFWHDASLTPLIRVSLLISFFMTISVIPTLYFQSLKRFKMNALVIVGQSLVSLAGIGVIASLNYWSIEGVIVVSVVATALGATGFMLLVPKASFFEKQEFHKPSDNFFQFLWRSPIRSVDAKNSLDSTGVSSFAFFMMLSTVIVTFITRADVWLMGIFVDRDQIGLYSVASRITLPLVIVLGALNTALWPRASSLTCLDKTTELVNKTFKLSMAIAFAGLFYALLGPMLIPFFFGSKYEGGVLLGQILCVRYCFAILTCPIAVIGYSFGMVKVYWWINLLQLIAVVTINIILLPKIGVLGSALALIANEIIGFCLAVTIIRHNINKMKAS